MSVIVVFNPVNEGPNRPLVLKYRAGDVKRWRILYALATCVASTLRTVKRLAADSADRGFYEPYGLKTVVTQTVSCRGRKPGLASGTAWGKKDIPYDKGEPGKGPLHLTDKFTWTQQ